MALPFRLAMTGLAVAVAAAPAPAQERMESSKFLAAVRSRDGNTVTSLLSGSSAGLVNSRDFTSNQTALHIVTRDRDLSWLGYLLLKGARPDVEDRQGETPLTLATQLGWMEGADLLLKAKATVDRPNGLGETPLIIAVRLRNPAMVRFLLSKGADPDRPDNGSGQSARDYAKRDARDSVILNIIETTRAPGRQVMGPPR